MHNFLQWSEHIQDDVYVSVSGDSLLSYHASQQSLGLIKITYGVSGVGLSVDQIVQEFDDWNR